MSKRCLTAVLLVAALSLPTGCVYYNTFYHARAAAREAELLREARAPDTSPGPAEKELRERVAEKCGRVLQLHPDSEWADDALLLLGTTRYYQERYESADRRLTEFLKLHSDSELLPEAEYMLASVMIERGNPASAETYLEGLAEASPPHPLSDDALTLIGRARHARKKYAEAAEAYERALERFPRSDRRAEIRFLSAENYEEIGDLDAAARQYALVPGERGARKLVFEARMRLAQVDLKRGRFDDALAVLGDIERRVDSRDDRDRVLLLKGLALEDVGAVDDAIATYEGISASHKKSEASAEAFYRIGLLHRDRHELLDEAVASFKRAKDEAPRSDVAKLASRALSDIDKLTGFLTTIAGSAEGNEDGRAEERDERVEEGDERTAGWGDTVGQVAVPAGAVSDTALHVTLLPSLDQSAGVGDVPGAPSAALDTTGIRLAPSAADTTDVARAVAAADTSAAPEPESEVAVARFRVAELYLFHFDDPERAQVYYRSVIEHHSESSLAPKAALALAWILKAKLDDSSAARAAYESILIEYPDSDFAVAAAESLGRLGQTGSD